MESVFDGKRKLFGCKPNLNGVSTVVKNKLMTKKYLMAQKTKKI